MSDHTYKLRPRLISGKWSIQGTAPVVGRIRKQFSSEDQAKLESKRLIAEVTNHLARAEVRHTLLTPKDENDASISLNILRSNPVFKDIESLYDLVRWAERRMGEEKVLVTLNESGKEYINDLKRRGRDQGYIKQVQNKINRVQFFYDDDFPIKDFTKDMVRAWIRGEKNDISPFNGKNVTKTTRTCELVFLKGWFNFAEGHDWIEKSPCKGVRGYGKNKTEVQCLNIEKTLEFMKIATDYSPEAKCYFALSLYAGLRPEELRPEDGEGQVCWEDFTWRGKGKSTLAVGYKVGKVTSRRVVTLPEICVRHIEQHAKDSGPVMESSYAQWRAIKDYIRAKAGYRVYGHHFKHIDPVLAKISYDQNRPAYVRDVLRHTAISYRLELYPDKHELAKWAGNSPAVIDEHYRALVRGDKKRTPKEYAKAFFEE